MKEHEPCIVCERDQHNRLSYIFNLYRRHTPEGIHYWKFDMTEAPICRAHLKDIQAFVRALDITDTRTHRRYD